MPLAHTASGNSCLGALGFTGALKHYTAALEDLSAWEPPFTASQRDSVIEVWSKISTCLLQLQRFEAARDASAAALFYNWRHVKSLLQSAKALAALGSSSLAISDLRTLLEIEPGNQQADVLLQSLVLHGSSDEVGVGEVSACTPLLHSIAHDTDIWRQVLGSLSLVTCLRCRAVCRSFEQHSWAALRSQEGSEFSSTLTVQAAGVPMLPSGHFAGRVVSVQNLSRLPMILKLLMRQGGVGGGGGARIALQYPLGLHGAIRQVLRDSEAAFQAAGFVLFKQLPSKCIRGGQLGLRATAWPLLLQELEELVQNQPELEMLRLALCGDMCQECPNEGVIRRFHAAMASFQHLQRCSFLLQGHGFTDDCCVPFLEAIRHCLPLQLEFECVNSSGLRALAALPWVSARVRHIDLKIGFTQISPEQVLVALEAFPFLEVVTSQCHPLTFAKVWAKHEVIRAGLNTRGVAMQCGRRQELTKLRDPGRLMLAPAADFFEEECLDWQCARHYFSKYDLRRFENAEELEEEWMEALLPTAEALGRS
ncbi:unnamed protein product [Polarella glacialis]|uniref:Uncharacterized protein n=1 Tax=Polarella glacialis TaxID=89957 RepID=A0A813I0P4_POLGL|nr:unnamed protein product [Polarella glacialis]